MSNRNGTQGGVMTTILNTMASREGDYKQGVFKNHSLSKAVAERLAPESLDVMLRNMNTGKGDDVVSEEEISTFLAEQKERVKALSMKNAKREANIDSFLGAINKMKRDFEGKNDDAQEQEVDYDSCIQNFMKEDEEGGKVDLLNSKICTEIREKLGEGEEGDEDEDIAVLKNNEESQAKYKCCITGMWMDDVVTSTICNHSYSREGIMSHLQKGKTDCPIVGCNQKIKESVLEEDAGMQRKARRMKRRLEAEEENRKKASVMDDDEEDE